MRPLKVGKTGAGLLYGVLYVVAWAAGTPGYDVPLVPFVCLSPFLALSLSADTVRSAALRGWLAGTAGSLPLYYWVAWTVAVPGNIGWAPGVLAALLVSAYVGMYASIAAAAVRRIEDRMGEGGIWWFPAVWVALETARSHLFTGFPWMLLGSSLAGSGTLRQAADLAGVPGLSFLLALSGVSVYLAGRRAASGAFAKGAAALLPGCGAVLFLVLYGWLVPRNSPVLQGVDHASAPRSGIKVAVAQGVIDQSLKWDPARQTGTLDIYETLTFRARDAGAEVVVWPETAAPFFYGWENALSRRLERIAADGGIHVVFGAPWYDPSGGGKYYNSVFHLDGRGVVLGRYDKRHLVPFGEYIPLRSLLSFLKKLTVGEEDFSAGTRPELFRISGTSVAASICYEAIFPSLLREGVLRDAEWFVNVTNDAWFGDTVAPRQHLAMARMRCVEFRRPMVRAANSGISALIGPDGGLISSLGWNRRGILVAALPVAGGKTLYAKTGDVFGIPCIIISGLTIIFPLRGNHGIRASGRKSLGA